MAEYIGARISLVSKSDIRYVGTLHEINSQDSTVALENVTSFGTEGRRENPEDEIAASTNVYEYIVFRGSDVKDLRIEDVPAVKEATPPNPPDDPAILQGHSRPAPHAQPAQRQAPNAPQGPQQVQSAQGPPFPHHPQYPPQFYPPPPAGWGRGGPPGPGGFPPMPYGAPPGWYPGPGQGFPPGPFPPSPYGYPPGPPGPFQQGPQPQQQQQPPKPSPIGPGGSKQTPPAVQPTEKPAAPKNLAKSAEPTAASQSAPTPPVASKPSPKEVAAAVAQVPAATRAITQNAPNTGGRVAPAVPRPGQASATSPQPIVPKQFAAAPGPSTNPTDKLTAATQAATAAVAAAMAKLPPSAQSNGNALDDLTNKVQQMRTTDRVVRAPAQPGRGAGFSRGGGRGGRGGFRGPQAAPTVELPGSDFDFDSANAKFNKEDLVKEAIAGSPLAENAPSMSPTDPTVPAVSGYNKSTSFFDNISSESKDRMEASNAKAGGREWRGEEQKKNVETFGQGSVDNGYRGGFRGGRGRGRGRGGYRGRGYSGNGQPRGGSNFRGQNAETTA